MPERTEPHYLRDIGRGLDALSGSRMMRSHLTKADYPDPMQLGEMIPPSENSALGDIGRLLDVVTGARAVRRTTGFPCELSGGQDFMLDQAPVDAVRPTVGPDIFEGDQRRYFEELIRRKTEEDRKSGTSDYPY